MNWIEASKANPPKSKLGSDERLGYSAKVLVRVAHQDGREAGYSFAKNDYQRRSRGIWRSKYSTLQEATSPRPTSK